MSSTSLAFPPTLYPAIAPLPAPMADHLLLQEQRQYQRRARPPTDQELLQTVLERIVRARIIVYEYLNPFVLADKKRRLRGENSTFPTSAFLLDTLEQYTPNGTRLAEPTIDYWQTKGKVRREKTRGLLDVSNLSALLVARLAEGNHQRNWLPSTIRDDEPLWWCYARSAPNAPILAVPVPFPENLPASTLLWTPWQGAGWDEQWKKIKEAHQHYWPGSPHVYHMFPQKAAFPDIQDLYLRWARTPRAQDLNPWDEALARKIQSVADDSLLGRESVQAILVQEASNDILASIEQKGIYHDRSTIVLPFSGTKD